VNYAGNCPVCKRALPQERSPQIAVFAFYCRGASKTGQLALAKPDRWSFENRINRLPFLHKAGVGLRWIRWPEDRALRGRNLSAVPA